MNKNFLFIKVIVISFFTTSCEFNYENGKVPEVIILLDLLRTKKIATTTKSLVLAPNQINNLQLWLEGDTLSLASGTTVSSWTDKSVNGFHATQGTVGSQPTYMDNLFNGKPGLRFTDGNPGTNLTLGANYLFSTNDGITIVAVARSNSEDSTNHRILDFGLAGNAGYGLGYSANSDGTGSNLDFYTAIDSGGKGTTLTFQRTTSEIVILVARVKFAPAVDKNQSVFGNGTQVGTDTSLTLTQLTAAEICENPVRGGGIGIPPAICNTTASNNGPVTIGGQSKTNLQANRFFNGDIAMVLFYDRAITETERFGIECYAAEKYGITISHGCTE